MISAERLKELHAYYDVLAMRAGVMSLTERGTALRTAEALIELEAARTRIAELDPDPVVCGCREAGCPHTPIAKLPRQALVDHYRERIKALNEQLRAQGLSQDTTRMDFLEANSSPGFSDCQWRCHERLNGATFREAVDEAISRLGGQTI